MSVYSVKGKGWRFDFTLNGQRYTEAWFQTKRDALAAEAKRKEELRNPDLDMEQDREPETEFQPEEKPTGMGFLELVNLRLDHVKAYNSVQHYRTYLVLYTRKKKGGHLTPRKVPMTERLQEIMKRRHRNRDKTKPWIFWHTYTSSKTGKKVSGPYKDRKKVMRSLCEKAGVRYFRYHPIRHSGATIMDQNGVPIGSIQSILGHEHRTTTEIYLHSTGNPERAAMAVFERASQKSHTESHTDEKGATDRPL